MFNKIILVSFVTIAWVVGGYELYDSVSNFSTQWYWIVLAMLYTCTINEMFLHEVMAHSDPKKINPNTITYKILVFLNTVDHCFGPVTNFCLLHKNHHQYSDTKYDHMNSVTHWHNNCIVSPWIFFMNHEIIMPKKEAYFRSQKKQYAHIINDNWTIFVEAFKIPLTILFWTLLFFTFPIILFKIVLMGRLLMSIINGTANIAGHIRCPGSYRNFDTKDKSWNNLVFHYLSLGLFTGMLHNNHHGLADYSTSQVRWFEFDPTRPIMASMKYLMKY